MIRALNEIDKRVLEVSNAYVMSTLVERPIAHAGPIDWRSYHEKASLQLMAYPKRKPKKDKK